MNLKDELDAITTAPYHLSLSSAEDGQVLDQDVEALLVIKREMDGTTRWFYRGINSFEASGLAHWAWRQMTLQQDDLTGESDSPMADEE